MPKAKLTKLAVRLVLATVLSAANLSAQDGRKVISNPVPVYPPLAKNNHIEGVVKVQVVIAADGHIKSTEVIGGHPLLADAVKDTLKHWKYSPATSETTALLEFHFHP